MRKERTRSKHGFNDFGGFLLGWILGFIFTICLMIIIGFWAYTSVNIKKIEKWGKIEITDNDGLENLTMEKMVSIIRSFNNTGYKDYTLGQLEEDFNIKLLDNSIYGIDLTRLKTAPLGELRDALDDTLDTITFTNVLRLMETDSENMGVFDTVLNNTLTYYLKDGKLYKNYSNNEYTDEAPFKCIVRYDTQSRPISVEFSNGSHTVSVFDGVYSVKPRLCDLPLSVALESINEATDNIKIYQLLDFQRTGTEGNYEYYKDGSKMSGIMVRFAEFTIDDIASQDNLNNIYIYEIMGYKKLVNGDFTYINDSNQEVKVTGAMQVIADKTIGEIAKPETINNLKIYEVMGYYYNSTDGYYYKNFDGFSYTNKITGTMQTLADKSLNDLSDPNFVNNLQVWEIMGFEQTGEEGSYVYLDNGNQISGVIATIAEEKISELGDITEIFEDATVADVMGYYYNTEDETYYTTYNETDGYTNPVTGIYAHLASAEIDEIPARINTLTLGQVLDKDIEETKGVIRALYNYNINQLSNKETINGIYVWQIMDYTQTEDGDYTYDNDGNVELVTGIMKAFAGKTIGEIADASIISQLKVFEVLGYYENEGKYYTSYDVETETYSGEVEGAIKALAGMAIKDLNDNDKGIKSISLGAILNIDSSATGVINALKDYKLGELDVKINELKIYQIMGYYENEGVYYTDYDEETETYTGEVTGIMGAIAESSINSIGGTIDGLTAVKVLGSDCKLLNLIEENRRDTILITELSTELTSAMTNATIQQLVDSEIITEIDTTKEAYADIKDKTITDIINMLLGE